MTGQVAVWGEGWGAVPMRPVALALPIRQIMPVLLAGTRVLMGAGVGVGFGAASGTMPLWLVLGCAVGAGFNYALSRARQTRPRLSPPS